MYYSGSLAKQLYLKVVGSKSRSGLWSEWVLRQDPELTKALNMDTAVCMQQQTGTEVRSV